MRKNFERLLALLLLLLSASVLAQEVGRPFIQNFPPRKYRADGQNWVITQDHRGMIYVGNTACILEYDGVNWRRIATPNNARVNRMAADAQGRVYVTAASPLGEFGYLAPDRQGNVAYQTLTDKLDSADRSVGNVFEVLAQPDGVYFFATRNILRWDGDSLMRLPTDLSFGRPNQIENVIYINSSEVWHTLQDFELTPLPGKAAMASVGVSMILPFQEGRHLVVARSGQLYVFNPATTQPLSPFPNEVTPFLNTNRLIHGVQLPNGNIAFSTAVGGIIVMDRRGRKVSVVNKESGLVENEVYYMYNDNQNGLWAGTGNGISRIELVSPFSKWYDEVGGWATTVIRHKGTLYAGALGAYYMGANGFESVEGIDRTLQSWLFYEYDVPGSSDKKLLFGNQVGLYHIEGGRASPIQQMGSVLGFATSKQDPTKLYVGGSGWIRLFNYSAGNWTDIKEIKGFTGEARSLLEDEKGNLWVGTYYNGVKYIEQPKLGGERQSPNIKEFGVEDGLPSLQHNRVYEINGETVFATKAGFYTFDEPSGKFRPHERYTAYFEESGRETYLVAPDNRNSLWVSAFKTNENPVAQMVPLSEDDGYEWYDTPFRRLPTMEMEGIFHDDDGVTWIAGSEGLFKYDSRLRKDYQRSYQAYIRKVIIGEDSLHFNGAFVGIKEKQLMLEVLRAQPKNDVPDFVYAYNALTFDYAAPFFDDSEDANEYRYKLEGYADNWSDWSAEHRKGYTNLPGGNYHFKVQARNTYGLESQVASFSFNIQPPWYLTVYAYLGYILFASLVVGTAVKINSRRLKAQNKRLEDIVAERTSEIATQKNQIERAYGNIKTISDIGQKITATLGSQQLIQTVYNSVNTLMDAEAFGVGVYDEMTDRLVFEGFIEKGERLEVSYDSLDDDSKLSVICFAQQQEVIVNDIEEDYSKYTGLTSRLIADCGEVTQSAVYLPLIFEDEPIGVITVQSFKKRAYSSIEITFLRTLASYVSIALSNTNSFELVERAKNQITDSIRYAETIQKAVLPSMERMSEVLHDYFVIWKPKDIVSGDFYWFSHVNERIYLAVVDCTGHGVQGAFMSMIGSSILGEVVNVERIYEPAKILEQLHHHVRLALRQREKKNTDGMDIGLVCISATSDYKLRLQYAGAKVPLYYVHGGELHEIKPTKKSIGGMQREDRRTFEEHERIMEHDDVFYLCTDGYVDQNAPDMNKIGSPRLKALLRKYHDLPLQDQHEKIIDLLEKHQQNSPQRDDITIVGVKL